MLCELYLNTSDYKKRKSGGEVGTEGKGDTFVPVV